MPDYYFHCQDDKHNINIGEEGVTISIIFTQSKKSYPPNYFCHKPQKVATSQQ